MQNVGWAWPRNQGFSLLELSIVLVIIGLLAGGVMTGQSLIRAAEIRTVSSEYQRYLTAANTFRDKYRGIPGDIANATSFWGDQATGTGACASASTADGTPGTCNGDSDSILDNSTNELYRFWQHLQMAGMLEGTYTGITGAGGALDSIVGTNVPASKAANSGWSVASGFNYGGDGSAYALDYGNYFVYGAQLTGSTSSAAVLKPEEAWNIDSKLDDGKPAYGKVIAKYWNNACAAADDGTHANTDLVASYNLTDTSLRCALFFIKPF